MSITIKNGSITLKNLAELGSVLDPQTLPPGPEVADSEPTSGSEVTQEAGTAQTTAPHDLASLLAQLSTISTGLDAMARQDAHARDQAALDLARYEALIVDKQETDRALAEVRRLRAAAEQLSAEAFTDEARAQAAQHAAGARAAELNVAQLLAERTREIEELAARPHLARALADRQRHAEQRAVAAQRAEAERANRLQSGLSALLQALDADQLDEARLLLEPLVREFPDDGEVRKRADALRWRLRQRLIAPAETALQEVVRRPYRDDPEAVMVRLADLNTENLPEDLARRVFGLWSNACYLVVQQRGWLEPKRHAPLTSRGMVHARPTSDGPATTVSSLGLPEWRPDAVVDDKRVLRASRPLEPPKSNRSS
jgi:hypothetical protein